MASVSGTGGSPGGGNQPPNKRSKMETDKLSIPEHDQDPLDSDLPGSVSSMIRVQPNHLQCPVCKEYPRMEVYQCDEGHIVCNECILKITSCPVCRTNYPEKKIRSRVAETDLDGITFKCSFRDEGCLEAYIPRNRRTAHDIQCEHNPSPPGFYLCSLFEHSRASQFRIDPHYIIKDPQHTNDVIGHLKRLPDLHYKKIEIGGKSSFRSRLPTSIDPILKPFGLFEVINEITRKTIGYYVLIERLSIPARNKLSYVVVGLNSVLEDCNGEDGNRHSDKITVTFSVSAKTDPNKVTKDGAGCVPKLSWTIKSMYLNEWEEFMTTPIEDSPPCSFSLPVDFLSEHYKQEDDMYKVSVRFGTSLLRKKTFSLILPRC